MHVHHGLLYFFLILGLVDKAFPGPAPSPSPPSLQEAESKLVEIKLPVKITSMEDLVAWAKNAMRSMASRIDITLATVDEPPEKRGKSAPPQSAKLIKQGGPIVVLDQERKRVPSADSIVSTYASLFGAGNSLGSVSFDENVLVRDVSPHSESTLIRDGVPRRENYINRDVSPRGNVNAYLPLLLDETEISRYREEALKKYYWENEDAKREKNLKASGDKVPNTYSQAIAQQTLQIPVENGESKKKKNSNEEKKITPVISVPFEAIVTITRENSLEQNRSSHTDTRDPPDAFPPYFNEDYPRTEVKKKNVQDKAKNNKDTSPKRQSSPIGEILRLITRTRKITNDKKVNPPNGSQINRPKKPSEKFTPPPPKFEFEDQFQRQRRNETSQKQEFDDDEEEEEPEGSLGSITDLLPLVIPILEDIFDPETPTDLGEILAAALPLIQGLSEPDDEDAPDIIGMIGPILTNILGGKDGTGSDVAAVLRPLIALIAPFIGPVLGPLIGPLLTASSNPPQGEGSSLATLISAVIGPLVEPNEPGGMSPLSVLTAGIIAALSKELRPGLPGGLDVGALVGAVLSGVIAGTSAGLSGSSGAKHPAQPYGPYVPYGGGPVQAGSANTRTRTGFQAAGSQKQQRPLYAPGNIVEHHRIVNHPSHRPYSTLPQNIPPASHPRPPPSPYVQHYHATGPLQADTTNNGGSSYLPYGTNAVPANNANPIGLIGTAIKDVLGAGIQVVSSVINAVFGIIGGSSSEEPRPVYGPPNHGSYGKPPTDSYHPQ